jgi:MFS-type transporter involved in bile tolerance (Atg22 family)
MGGLGTSIAFLVGGMLHARNPIYPFALAAVVLVIAEAIVVWRVKEPASYTTVEQPSRPGLLDSLRQTVANVVEIARASDKSALFICLAIFCWFMGYNAVEAFWTSYGREVIYAGQIAAGALTADQAVSRSTMQLTYLSAAFLLFALPAGLVATRFGRKRTIVTGLGALALLWLGLWLIPHPAYVTVALILSGVAWACVNINSLPVVADLAPRDKVGAYTGLYYFFSMLAASTSPTIVGWLMDALGLKVMFPFASLFMALALVLVLLVRRTEPGDAEEQGVAGSGVTEGEA